MSLLGGAEGTESPDGPANARTVGWWWKVGIAAAVAPLVSFSLYQRTRLGSVSLSAIVTVALAGDPTT